jgi:hypothetical protein
MKDVKIDIIRLNNKTAILSNKITIVENKVERE